MRIASPGIAGAALAAAAVCLFLPATRAEDSPAPRAFRPYVTWSGPESRVEKREYVRVTGAEEWRRLWARHAGMVDAGGLYGPPMPEVDFGQCMVVAVFEGGASNTRGLTAISVTEEKERIVLRYDWQSKSYQTMDTADRVILYGIFVLPRSSKAVVVEEDTHTLITGDPTWKERVRFERL